jgi:single-strand DNA-binding protein
LQQRSWEQDGQKRSKVEVVVEDFNFVGGGSGDGSGSSNYSAPKNDSASSSESKTSKKEESSGSDDLGNEPINLDDIPF